MERLRRSFRNSFRRKKPQQPESSKPHQWEADEQAVRNGNCSFPVKYLGCVQVDESRGMHVCEQALIRLKSQKHKSIKGLLYVSGDGLRVVDDETKGLIVDQTIEKVSFCAPDRNLDRGFSYICRDGTTRRWMCHGFLATKDTGERLSHAVGCAFSVCLERKQKRDLKLAEANNNNNNNNSNNSNNSNNNSNTSNINNYNQNHNRNNSPGNGNVLNNSISTSVSTISDSNGGSLNSVNHNASTGNGMMSKNFQRCGSFRRVPMIQRIKDPQECKTIEPVPIKEVVNPYAIERPHATPQLLERQGSFRIFNSLNQSSPFKRQLSLRVQSSHSRMDRQRNNSLQAPDPLFGRLTTTQSVSGTNGVGGQQPPDNAINAMCKELSQGLSLLSNAPNLNSSSNSNSKAIASNSVNHAQPHAVHLHSSASAASKHAIDTFNVGNKTFGQLSSYTDDLMNNVKLPVLEANQCRASPTLSIVSNQSINHSLNAIKSNASIQSNVKQTDLDLFSDFEVDFDKHFGNGTSNTLAKESSNSIVNHSISSIQSIQSNSQANPTNTVCGTQGINRTHVGVDAVSRPDQGNGLNVTINLNGIADESKSRETMPTTNSNADSIATGSATGSANANPNSKTNASDLFESDPFDAEWVSLAGRHNNDFIKNTNPFLVPNPVVKAFEIKM